MKDMQFPLCHNTFANALRNRESELKFKLSKKTEEISTQVLNELRTEFDRNGDFEVSWRTSDGLSYFEFIKTKDAVTFFSVTSGKDPIFIDAPKR